MSNALVSQVAAETLAAEAAVRGNVSQLATEALSLVIVTNERASQVATEALVVAPLLHAYVSQLAVEVLVPANPIIGVQLPLIVAEILTSIPGPPPPPPPPAGPAAFNILATVISQYCTSPTLVRLVENMGAYIDPTANLDQFFTLMWNVDTAVGYGLDVWGRIVGVQRVLTISAGNFFGFSEATTASASPFNQAPFYNGEAATSNYALDDQSFRALILAKALANICDGSIRGINQILINIFGPNGVSPVAGNSYVTDNGGMVMTYTFGSPLTPVQAAIVGSSGVLPKPVGVTATVVQ